VREHRGYVEPGLKKGNVIYNYVYQYKDHLGNIRLSYKDADPKVAVNINDNFNSGTDGWSNTGSGSINSNNDKLNINIINKWNNTSKYVDVTPNEPLHIAFDFEEGNMVNPVFFVKERINGVWEPNGNRDIFYMQDGHFEVDLVLTGDHVRLYFEKGSASDHGILTACYVDNFLTSQNVLEILEENNYYPFGLKHKGYNNVINGTDHKYGFGGKEENEELGLDWHDFGARNYDASLGRWMNVDPLAEQMRRHSPYNYAYNNPLVFTDPDGMAPFTELFDKSGNKIGEDENGVDGNIAVVTNNEEMETVKANTAKGTHTESSSLESKVDLPSQDTRVEMGIAVKRSDLPSLAGDDTKGGFHEEGGTYGESNGTETVVHAESGAANTEMLPGSKASVNTTKPAGAKPADYKVTGTFHVHPKGTKSGRAFVQWPSQPDLNNTNLESRGTGNHFVLGSRSGTVYIYNTTGTIARKSIKTFTQKRTKDE
jgi:RHS repeat-associated protein